MKLCWHNFLPICLIFLLASTGIVAAQKDKATPIAHFAQQGGDQAMQANNALSPQDENRLIREVRHELLMLPYYGVFDDLKFQVEGHTVILSGYVTSQHSVTKSDAENAVKHIEGVEKVVNKIEVLPPSPMDDRIRMEAYRAIYGYGPLFKYANMTIPSIHIIVKNGHITLEGVVDSESDKNIAGIRANTVPGVFSVTNNLQVVNQDSGKGQK
jgi:hyperosmotically inducible protein